MKQETEEQRIARRDREYLKLESGAHINLVEVSKMAKIGDLKIEGLSEEEKKQVWDAASKLRSDNK